MFRAGVEISAPNFFFFFFFCKNAPSFYKKAPPQSYIAPFLLLFPGGGGANEVFLVQLAPLSTLHYGPRPRWPPPCYGPVCFEIFKLFYVNLFTYQTSFSSQIDHRVVCVSIFYVYRLPIKHLFIVG